MTTRVGLLLLFLFSACASGPVESVSRPALPPTLPGLTIGEGPAGDLADYPPVREARSRLGPASARAAAVVLRRLGLALDPDRPRLIRIAADSTIPLLETRLILGRMTQVITVPAVPVARGNLPLEEILTDVFARAALTDVAAGDLPTWYVAGAPLWVSGGWRRLLASRVLAGPVVPGEVDAVAPPLDLSAGTADPLSAALFFHFLGQEFGARKVPALTRALLSAPGADEALRAALHTDPASLPVAYDGFRIRTVTDLLADDHVRLLAAARTRPPADRIPALSGLARRAPDRFIAAALLEDLALAQFEAGDYAAAARTFGTVEEEYAPWALRPDRDLLYFALCFARQDGPEGAAVRIESFLAEYPESPYAALALFELAGLLTASDRAEAGLARYREIVRRFPDSPQARPARIVLAAAALSRHHYAAARRLLEAIPSDPTAVAWLAKIEEVEKAGLPDEARAIAGNAVRDLLSGDPAAAARGKEELLDIGPAARGLLAAGLQGEKGLRPGPDALLRAIDVLARWPKELVWPTPLAVLFGAEDERVARALFDALARLGVTAGEIGTALGESPSPAAAREYDRRFRSGTRTDRLLSSDSFRDRMLAANRLAGEERKDALALLGTLLGDASPQVRRVAALALGERPERESAAEALRTALDDGSRLVRVEALRSLLRLGDADTLRTRGVSDVDPLVRVETARLLYLNAEPRDLAAVVALLADPEATVRMSVETILRFEPPRALGEVLANAFRSAEMPVQASRILRVMTHHTGTDFGYDRSKGRAERERVASAFLAAFRKRVR